jgi:hypothetical protein
MNGTPPGNAPVESMGENVGVFVDGAINDPLVYKGRYPGTDSVSIPDCWLCHITGA